MLSDESSRGHFPFSTPSKVWRGALELLGRQGGRGAAEVREGALLREDLSQTAENTAVSLVVWFWWVQFPMNPNRQLNWGLPDLTLVPNTSRKKQRKNGHFCGSTSFGRETKRKPTQQRGATSLSHVEKPPSGHVQVVRGPG